MKSCRLMTAALLVFLFLCIGVCAYAAEVHPIGIIPGETDLNNGIFCLGVTGEDQIEKNGFFTAELYLADRYDAEQIRSLSPGDTVLMNGAFFSVREILLHEAEVPGEEDVYEVCPAEDYDGYLVFFPNPDGTFSALIDDWIPVTPVGEIRVSLPLPDGFTYISVIAGEEDDPMGADAFLEDLGMFGGFLPWNTTCILEDGNLVNVTHASYPWGPEDGWPADAEENAADTSSGSARDWEFCRGDPGLLETSVIKAFTTDCEAGPSPVVLSAEEAEQIRSLALYGTVTGKENDTMVTGGTFVYLFETPDGNPVMALELYHGLLIGSDGMYRFEIRRDGDA